MEPSERNINIDYLRNGVYYDKLSSTEISEKYSEQIINNNKKKYMNYSNSLNNLINDKTYIDIINKTSTTQQL
jgi:hypothetical protein